MSIFVDNGLKNGRGFAGRRVLTFGLVAAELRSGPLYRFQHARAKKNPRVAGFSKTVYDVVVIRRTGSVCVATDPTTALF